MRIKRENTHEGLTIVLDPWQMLKNVYYHRQLDIMYFLLGLKKVCTNLNVYTVQYISHLPHMTVIFKFH